MDSAALDEPHLPPPTASPAGADVRAPMDAAEFAVLYDDNVAFIHRAVRRLGIHEPALEDVVQEVFLTAFRRYPTFRRQSSLRTWLYGIAIHVVRLHRRTTVRAGLHGIIDASAGDESERVADASTARPDVVAETRDAWRTLMRLLDELDDDKREIFVLAELEELPVPEIADLLGLKLNTAYSRLRLARGAFEAALGRLRSSR